MKIALPKKLIIPSNMIIDAGIGMFAAVVNPFVDSILKVIADIIKKYLELGTMPELYSKHLAMHTDCAEDILKGCGLNYVLVPMTVKNASVLYKECFDGEVIHTNPRPHTKIEPTETVIVSYITQEVIDKSIILYEEAERAKAEKLKQKHEKKEAKKAKADNLKKLPIKLLKKKPTME